MKQDLTISNRSRNSKYMALAGLIRKLHFEFFSHYENQLIELLMQKGVTTTEIAKHLGVSKQAVSERIKRPEGTHAS